MDIATLFLKANLPIIISSAALLFSGLTFYLNRKKFAIDKYNRNAEFFLGVSKVKEILSTTDEMKNTDPSNLTAERYYHDKTLIESLLVKYAAYENQIVKANYVTPDVIMSLQSAIKRLDKNFSGISENYFHSAEVEQVINYRSIYFSLSILASIIASVKEYPNSQEQKLHIHFLSLYAKFDQKNLETMQSSFSRSIELMKRITDTSDSEN